jgi:hypothetical protein
MITDNTFFQYDNNVLIVLLTKDVGLELYLLALWNEFPPQQEHTIKNDFDDGWRSFQCLQILDVVWLDRIKSTLHFQQRWLC